MMLLRCTAKVLKLLEQQPRKVELSQSQTSPQEWYVNFVDGLGPAFALCVNPLSLYTLVLSADHLDGAGDLAGRLLGRLTLHMVELGIDRTRVKRLAQECSGVLVAKTASRSVLGSMNDLINHFCWHFSKHMSEKGKVDLWAIEQELNNMPQRPIGWKYAQERFTELCSKF